MDVVVIVHGDAELLEVVDALGAAGRFAGRLNRRQQQRHQDANNGDHHQELDEGKTV